MKRSKSAAALGGLSPEDAAVLGRAAGPAGVIQYMGNNGLGKTAFARRMRRLCEHGLASESPYDDWYITPAGRNALLAFQESNKQ